MEGGQDNYSEDIDDFYVVDSWSDEPNCSGLKLNNSVDRNILSKEDKLLRKKPTEGEIDEFLENLKQSNSNCGTSGLEGNICNSFNSWNRSGDLSQIPEGDSRDKLCVVNNQAAKQSSKRVESFKQSIVSYKPGETLTKTFFSETSNNDLSRSYNYQKINIPSSDPFFHVSFDRNEDSRGGFSDVKGSQYTNGRFESTNMESSSRHPRRSRSRSPYRRYSPVRENRFAPREGGRNHSHLDNLRNDRNVIQDRRYHEDTRRHRRSRSRSRERRRHRRQSYERRSSLSISPSPNRESGNHSSMEPRQLPPPYYQNSGTTMPPNSNMYMNSNPNPNMGFSNPGPVQYPVNPQPSNTSYGRYPAYDVPTNNLFNNSHTQPHPFQPQIQQNPFPDPQNFNLYNPPNPVSYPAPWNQSSAGFNQNYSMPNVSPEVVMYPHLKIAQPRVDSYKSTYRESLDGSPPLMQRKGSVEKRIHSTSRSPDHKKHKRKNSKRHSKSPVMTSRYDSKKPKVVIDPNRIPTPPPPPIVGSYRNDDSKRLIEQKVKNIDGKRDSNRLSEFLNKEKVSLSSLLEAVMETSGQGKSQLSDPKVKKEIISNCESKIQHLYKRRMTGLGAFIPDPVQYSRAIAFASPLVTVYSPFTYNCDEENYEWHCPDIIVPEIKMKENLKVPDDSFTTSKLPVKTEIRLNANNENPSVIPTLSSNQSSSELSWNASKPGFAQHMFPDAYNDNQQNMFPSHSNPQTWSNPVHSQSLYPIHPPVPGSTNEYSLGPTHGIPPPSYPFSHPSTGPPFMPEHGYPPQPEILSYPPRMDYPTVHCFSSQNLNHPGMFNSPQPDLNRSNYQYKTEEIHKLKKNINKVNDNLILLSDNSSSHSDVAQKEKNGRNQNNFPEDTFRNDDKAAIVDPKDKLLRKVWKIRKSSEYDNVLTDSQKTKEAEDSVHCFSSQNLNHPGMFNSPQPDSNRSNYQYKTEEIHKLEKNENKVNDNLILLSDNSSSHSDVAQKEKNGRNQNNFPEDTFRNDDKAAILDPKDKPPGQSHYRTRSRRAADRERRKKCRSVEGDHRERRKKCRSVEGDHDHSRKRKELFDKKDHCRISSREGGIEISDEDRKKHKLKTDDCTNVGSKGPDGHLKPSLSRILESLGSEIRKIQEKSDLYKSVIDNLVKGDKAYKRLYSFRNQTLMKSHVDNSMKIIVPRDNLKEFVTLIHNSFHHVQSDELSRVLRNISFPHLLYLPKCISKVMSECNLCIEEKKKIDEPLINQKAEKKPLKKDNRSSKVRDRDRRDSTERYKRVSKDKNSSSSSKEKREPFRRVKEKDRKDSGAIDGIPSGYEKAIKVRKPGVSSDTKPDKVATDNQSLKDKSVHQIDANSSELLHGLNDKALEFKQASDCATVVSEDRLSNAEEFNQQPLTALDKRDYESSSFHSEISKIDTEDIVHDAEIESLNNITKLETEPLNAGTNPEAELMKAGTKPEIEPLTTATKPEIVPLTTATKPEIEPSTAVIKPVMETSNTFTKSEAELSNTLTKPEAEPSNAITKPEIEPSNTIIKPEKESSVTKYEIELSNIIKSEKEPLPIVTKSEKEPLPIVTKSEKEPSNTITKPKKEFSNTFIKSEIESSNIIAKNEIESSNIIAKNEIESSNIIAKNEIESTDSHTESLNRKELDRVISESSDSLKVDSVDKNQKPNDSPTNMSCEVGNPSNIIGKVSNENNSRDKDKKASVSEQIVGGVDNKGTPKLDFKGRVRQVQMSSDKCKNIIKALESQDGTNAADPSYLVKGGMLCRKDTTGNTMEVKIVVPSDELEKVVNIVHTMSAVHTSPAKVVTFFLKHFTQVENLDVKVKEIVSNCSCCKLKSS